MKVRFGDAPAFPLRTEVYCEMRILTRIGPATLFSVLPWSLFVGAEVQSRYENRKKQPQRLKPNVKYNGYGMAEAMP
jgi:hypothetical protein